MWPIIRRLRRRLQRIMGKVLETKASVNDIATDSPAAKPGESGYLTDMMSRLVLSAVSQSWKLCSTALLLILLCYWQYGSLIALVLLVFAFVGALYNLQDKLLYYPNQPPNARIYVESPAMYDLPYENIFIKARDGVRINVVFIKQEPALLSSAPTVIFLHGNAGNVGHRLLNSMALHSYCGVNILLVEYRGYGKSSGEPGETGFYLDAEAAMDYLMSRTDIDRRQIIIMGRSLGGAVSVHLASQPYYAAHVMCLLLENTFTSLPAIGRSIFDFKAISMLPIWAFKNQYPTACRIEKVILPTLFLSGQADNLIPPKMMQELYDMSGSKLKRMAKFATGSHNETWQCQGYYETISRFIVEVKRRRSQLGEPVPEEGPDFPGGAPFDDNGRYPV